MKAFTIRLAAHIFTRSENGGLQVLLFQTKAQAQKTVASFPEASAQVDAFGATHAPCVVWASCVSHPHPRGFDTWSEPISRRTYGEEARP